MYSYPGGPPPSQRIKRGWRSCVSGGPGGGRWAMIGM